MSIGDRLSRSAFSLLSRLGYDVTFRRLVGATYDPNTGSVSGGSNDDETITGLFVAYRLREIDGETIQRGDRKLLMSSEGLGKTPQVGDVFIGKGDEVRAVDVQTIEGRGGSIAYVVQVRE